MPGFDGERQVEVQAIDGLRHLLLKTQSLRTPEGDRYKVVAITDVTQLTKALHDIEQHRRQWQAVNAAVVIADACAPNMPITYVNPMFEQMNDHTSAEVIGLNCRFLQGNDLQQPGLMAIKAAIESGRTVMRSCAVTAMTAPCI